MTSHTCVHTVHNNTNMNTIACFQNYWSYICTYPIQQQKHKYLSSTAPSIKPSKYPITLLFHVSIGSTYTAPSIVPITPPPHKPSSDPTYVPSWNPTTNQIKAPSTKTSGFQILVPSLEHHEKNTSYITSHVTFCQGILVQHLHLLWDQVHPRTQLPIMLYTKLHKETHQLHLTCWNSLSKTGDGKWILWTMGDDFYDVVMMKMKFNWKCNWKVSFMETK